MHCTVQQHTLYLIFLIWCSCEAVVHIEIHTHPERSPHHTYIKNKHASSHEEERQHHDRVQGQSRLRTLLVAEIYTLCKINIFYKRAKMSGPIMSGPIMRSDNGNNGRPSFIIYVYYRISRLLTVTWPDLRGTSGTVLLPQSSCHPCEQTLVPLHELFKDSNTSSSTWNVAVRLRLLCPF